MRRSLKYPAQHCPVVVSSIFVRKYIPLEFHRLLTYPQAPITALLSLLRSSSLHCGTSAATSQNTQAVLAYAISEAVASGQSAFHPIVAVAFIAQYKILTATLRVGHLILLALPRPFTTILKCRSLQGHMRRRYLTSAIAESPVKAAPQPPHQPQAPLPLLPLSSALVAIRCSSLPALRSRRSQ